MLDQLSSAFPLTVPLMISIAGHYGLNITTNFYKDQPREHKTRSIK